MKLTFAQNSLPLAYDTDEVIRVEGTRVTLDTIVYRDNIFKAKKKEKNGLQALH